MKSLFTVPVCCFLLVARSSSAIPNFDHAEAEDQIQQRKRDLNDNTPLNEDEISSLKRMLSSKTLRLNDNVSNHLLPNNRRLMTENYANDPLAKAMHDSAVAKLKTSRRAGRREVRGNQDEFDSRKLRNGKSYYDYGNSGNRNQETNWEPPHQRAGIPEKVSMVLEAFQDSRMLQEPVLAGDSYLSPGTQYLYANEPLFNVVYDVPPGSNNPFYLVNERDKIATVSGECVRTDPKIDYVGKSYCQFEYRFLDSSGNVEASLSASGPVSKGDIDTLAITGGSGIFRRTVGTVILQSGSIKRGSPPYFAEDPTLDLPSSYLVKMFVFLDSVDLELASS